MLTLILAIVLILFGYIGYSFYEVYSLKTVSKKARLIAIGFMALPIVVALISLIFE